MANYVLCIEDYLFGEDVLCSVGKIYPFVIAIVDEVELYEVYFNKINCIFFYDDSNYDYNLTRFHSYFILLSEWRQNRLVEILND